MEDEVVLLSSGDEAGDDEERKRIKDGGGDAGGGGGGGAAGGRSADGVQRAGDIQGNGKSGAGMLAHFAAVPRERVKCPVCQREFSSAKEISMHIDHCLGKRAKAARAESAPEAGAREVAALAPAGRGKGKKLAKAERIAIAGKQQGRAAASGGSAAKHGVKKGSDGKIQRAPPPPLPPPSCPPPAAPAEQDAPSSGGRGSIANNETRAKAHDDIECLAPGVESEASGSTNQKQHDQIRTNGKKKSKLRLAQGSARTSRIGTNDNNDTCAAVQDAPPAPSPTNASSGEVPIMRSGREAVAAPAAAATCGGGGGMGGSKLTKRTVTAFFRQPAHSTSDLEAGMEEIDNGMHVGADDHDVDESKTTKRARDEVAGAGGRERRDRGEDMVLCRSRHVCRYARSTSPSQALHQLMGICVAPGVVAVDAAAALDSLLLSLQQALDATPPSLSPPLVLTLPPSLCFSSRVLQHCREQ